MKYDECSIVETNIRPNDNIIKNTKKFKIGLLDIFILQSVVCTLVSCGFMISKLF